MARTQAGGSSRGHRGCRSGAGVAGSEHSIGVLIVEDDDAFAELLATCLGLRPGLRVEGRASSVDEGAVTARDEAVDVVVTDYRLPDGTGAALTRRLRALAPRPPVIVMTADVDQEIVRDSAQAGALTVLDKLAGPAGIAETIRRIAALGVNLS